MFSFSGISIGNFQNIFTELGKDIIFDLTEIILHYTGLGEILALGPNLVYYLCL